MRVKGQVVKILFESGSYKVCRMKTEDARDLVIAGDLDGVSEGDPLLLEGENRSHPRYGEQLKVSWFAKTVPVTQAALAVFLEKNIKGVGPKSALAFANVWEKFDRNLDKIWENRKNIPLRKALLEKIVDKLKLMEQNEEVFLSLLSQGLTYGLARKIQNHFGERAVQLVRENPYRLCEEVRGVGFATADEIARKNGIPLASRFRLRAAAWHLLKKQLEQGDLFLPMDECLTRVQELTGVKRSDLRVLHDILAKPPFAVEGRSVFLREAYDAEKEVAFLFARLLKSRAPLQSLVKRLADFLRDKPLDVEQRQALETCLTYLVSVLTGGPGTGKTHTLSHLCAFLDQQGIKYALAAPTGRAAKRIQELTGKRASTLHRLLELDPFTGDFQRNERNPLQEKMVIVDEVSMMDIFLCRSLLKAIPPECHLFFIGDHNQLPSVGPGNVLRDLIESRRVPVVYLARIHRQKHSLLVENAHRILRGQFVHILKDDPSFLFMEAKTAEEAEMMLLRYCAQAVKKNIGFHRLQVMSPMYKGACGIDKLNAGIRRLRLPAQSTEKLSAGDKIIYLSNNYQKGIFNGDIGEIERVEGEELLVRFQDRTVALSKTEREDLSLAYCISVHKAQGSEFDAVILPVLSAHYVMLNRALLYTAVTRARKQCVLIGQKKALFMAIRNNRQMERRTMLARRLKDQL